MDEEDAALIPAFVDDEAEEIKPAARPVPDVHKEERHKAAEPEEEATEIEDEVEQKRGKKGKGKQRELVFDEARGEVVSRRRRKGSRRREEWEDYLE